jgi:hypothetical protein
LSTVDFEIPFVHPGTESSDKQAGACAVGKLGQKKRFPEFEDFLSFLGSQKATEPRPTIPL